MASIINASSTGSGGIVQTADASGVLQLQNNGTVAVTVTGGNVGVGTESPTAQLEISRSSTSAYSTMRLSNTGASGKTYEIGLGGNTAAAGYANNLYFYDSTAGAIRMAITSAGNITAPSQTGFKATKLSNIQSIPSSTWTRVAFNTTTSPTGGFNTGSAYSTSTNRFTAPVTGKYIFTASVNINSAVVGQMYIDFGLNGSNNTSMEASVAYPVGDTTLTTSTVINMVANDTMEVDIFTTNATTCGNRTCGFSGQLLS